MTPLELCTAADVAARESLLSEIRYWGRDHASTFPGASLVVHGSLARGDYWERGDVDVLVDGPTQEAKEALKDSFETWWNRAHPTIDLDIWPLNQCIGEFSKRSVDARVLPNPIQFGLYGFDLVRHHIPVVGPDFLVTFRASVDLELVRLARDRLHALVTAGRPGYDDSKPKRAIEALKAATILRAVESGRPPTRDKRVVLSAFLAQHSKQTFLTETAVKAWVAYRFGTTPPADDALDGFVQAVAKALSTNAT